MKTGFGVLAMVLFVLIFLYVYILLRKLIQKDNSLLTQSGFSKFKNLNISIDHTYAYLGASGSQRLSKASAFSG